MAAIQFLFYGLSSLKIGNYKLKKHLLAIQDIPVSIIIASHNNLSSLKNLIEKLYIQAYGNFEIIVVNDRSTDGTYEYLQSEKIRHPNVKLVHVESTPPHINEKKYALSLGIKIASNDCLLFTDSDCDPLSIHWIKNMSEPFKDEKDIVLGFSYYKHYPGFLNLFIRHETLQTGMLYLTMALLKIPYMGVGRNLGYRKSFFIRKKGFKKYLKVVGGDDDIFVNQFASPVNTQVVLHPDAMILSEPKKSFKKFFYQKIRHLSTGKRYKFRHKLILAIYALSKLCFWVLGAVLLVIGKEVFIVAGTILMVLLLISWAFRIMMKKLCLKYEIGWAWLMDFVYISYLVLFSLVAFSSKRIKWH